MDKKHEVLKFLKTVEFATLKEIAEAVPFYYYHNTHKYVGEILSRLVKRGLVFRIKKGVFKINPNQKILF